MGFAFTMTVSYMYDVNKLDQLDVVFSLICFKFVAVSKIML